MKEEINKILKDYYNNSKDKAFAFVVVKEIRDYIEKSSNKIDKNHPNICK